MANGIVMSGKFSKALLDKNVKVWVGTSAADLAKEMPYYKKLASHDVTNELVFQVLDGVERGTFQRIPENGKPHEETDLPGFKTTFNVQGFGLIKSISKMAGMADAASHMQKTNKKMAARVGKGYIRKLNEDVRDVLLNGFNTAYTSYGDNKPFFSTTHTRIDGGATTYRSNASSTSIPLSYDNLKTGRSAIRRVVDGGGDVVDYTHKRLLLIVPSALEDTAYEAIGTPKHLYKTTTTNFTPNALQSNGVVDIMVHPLLGAEAGGSDTAWYLKVADMGDEEAIQVYHKQGLDILTEKDFDTQKYKVRGDAFYAIGWGDPVGKWWGSKGDSSAYSS